MSIYDIKIASWDGITEDLLEQVKGKVTLITNVTTDCGNAPQFGIIEEIYREYKDQGFEVIAVPTNEFCGEGVTYGEWETDGIRTAEESYKYARENFDVTFNFTEMVKSKPGEGWYKQLPEGESPHPLFETLSDITSTAMFGNFEKYLIDREGRVVKRYANGTLLDYAHDDGQKIGSSEEEIAILRADIEAALDNQLTPWERTGEAMLVN